MAKKGKLKNGTNKTKHTKLIQQKKNKLKKEKEVRRARLKAILEKARQNK